MNFDEIFRTFWDRPIYQRLFLAFTVGLFLSCAARMAGAAPVAPADDAPASREAERAPAERLGVPVLDAEPR